MSTLPDRWQIKPLGEIVKLKHGKSLSKADVSEIGEFPVYGANGIIGRTSKHLHDKPTVVIGRVGASGQIHLTAGPAWFSDNSIYVSEILGDISLDFLYYLLRFANLLQFATKTSQPLLTQSTIRKQAVALPPLESQKRIVALLKRTEMLREKREQANQLTSKIIQSVFVKMFGNPATNPKRWPSHELLELAELRGGIQLSKERRPKSFPRPYLTIRNVYAGRLDLSDVRNIEVPDEQLERWILKPGDLLVLEGGDRDDVGRTAMFRGELKNCVHQNHVFRVRVNLNLLVPEYLMHYLNSDHIKSQFFMLAKATTGINSINMTQLKSVGVLCPPIAIQKDFARFVEHVGLLNSRQIQSATEINQLFHSLMHKAFRGELAMTAAS
jgi:type I restriction enzyme S subunit